MALLTSSIEGLSTTTRNAPNVELLGTNSEAVSTCTDNYSNVVLFTIFPREGMLFGVSKEADDLELARCNNHFPSCSRRLMDAPKG
ncbi:hypothetical protein V6N13_070705 [Hibiscus sabdariffa]